MQLLGEINWSLVLGPLGYFIIVGGLLDGLFVFVFLRLRKYLVAIGEALVANIFSLLTGFYSWPYIFPTGFDFEDLSMVSYGLLWLVTVITEALVQKLFNRSKAWTMIFLASMVMNLVSFAVLYLYFWIIN